MSLFRVFIFVALIGSSPARGAEPNQEMIEIWGQFLEIMSKGDIDAIVKRSASEIDCWLWPCTYREGREYKYPVREFYKIHSEYLFSKKLVGKLQTGKKFFVVKEDGVTFEVIITTVEPNEKHDGLQTAFYFKKINDKYLFSHISTIP